MNLPKAIAELRTECEHVDQATLVLERIAAGRVDDADDHQSG